MPELGINQRLEKSIKAAFATNDLHRICRAIDVAVLKSPSIIKVARDAGVNRTTLYRAFRCERGPALNTMINVLRVLGFQLVVQTNCQRAINPTTRKPRGVRALYEHSAEAKVTARLLTVAFRSCELDLVVKALAETLHAQENIARVARKTIRARETLYRAFVASRIPRFSTVLSFLDALELQLAVKRLLPGDKRRKPIERYPRLSGGSSRHKQGTGS
jgi:probable addiction module antidote protein